MYDIVESGEGEFYPLEILSTILATITIVLAFLLFYEDRNASGKNDKLYFALVIVFIAYLLAESNWLPGRETLVGTALLGVITMIVFIFTLIRTYHVNKTIFFLFLCGIIFLVLGTAVDFIHDNHIELTFQIPSEEVLETFAILFFVHSMLLLYLHNTMDDNGKHWFDFDRTGTAVILVGALSVGFGNRLLMCDHGEVPATEMIVLGILLYVLGLIMIILSIMNAGKKEKKMLRKVNDN